MAKFHCSIGYTMIEETSPGVHTQVVTEKSYTGDILRNSQRWDNSENLNQNFNVNNRFSVVANAYAYENFDKMIYILWNGTKWKISSAEIQRPRIVLSIGGVYNGQ